MRKVIIVVAVFVLLLSCAIAISGKMRPLTRVVVAACDTVPCHFTVVDGRITQNNSINTIVDGLKGNEDFNKATLFINIDSWNIEDWKLGAYIILGVHYEFGIPPINAYEIGLYEQWTGDKPECRIGFGPQSSALINTYIEWMSDPSKRPTKEQCREKIGTVR